MKKVDLHYKGKLCIAVSLLSIKYTAKHMMMYI